jgi:hypothetical protein
MARFDAYERSHVGLRQQDRGWGPDKLWSWVFAGEGLVTYIRTDGLQMSAETVQAIRLTIEAQFGKDQLPPVPREYK